MKPKLVPRGLGLNPTNRPTELMGKRFVPSCSERGGVELCPHDNHYYGTCGTIPRGTNFGSEFGWPSADMLSVIDEVTPDGQDKMGEAGPSDFLQYRNQVKNPDWTVESMLYPNSTLTRELPSFLGPNDVGTRAGLDRWLYLTQVLQARCVGGSILAYRQSPRVMGSLNWAINSIWHGPAWGSISHDGSWKLLHYQLRHDYAPLLLSFVAPVTLPDPADPEPSSCASDEICLHVSNHLAEPVSLRCTLDARRYVDGGSVLQRSFAVAVDALAGSPAATFPLRDLLRGPEQLRSHYLSAICDRVGPSTGSHVVARPFFPSSLANATLGPARIIIEELAAHQDGFAFNISSNTTVPYLFISSTTAGTFNDNAFLLRPSQSLLLRFTVRSTDVMPEKQALSVAGFLQSLKVYTLNSKYPCVFPAESPHGSVQYECGYPP